MSDERLALIRAYVTRGWAPVPVPARSKNPGFDDWEKFRTTAAQVTQHFPPGRNVGLLLGEPSGGLVDVDLDSTEARHLARWFLPPTGMVHGRAGKPASHWWYVCDPSPDGTRQFKDVGGAALVELRSTGGQTIVPPSVHQSGETIAWEQDGAPAAVDGRLLEQGVAQLAACVLLGRHWPAEGSRHEAALAVAGALLRNGWAVEQAEQFVSRAARVAGDAELRDRERAVRDTAENLATGRACTGLPRLAEIVGERVVERFARWLGLHRDDGRLLVGKLAALRPAIEQRRPWQEILQTVPVPYGRLPERLAGFVGYLRQYTPMFPDDWPIMMTLPFWSVLWPGVRLQNLNLVVWSLGIGQQGVGKNTATEEARDITQRIAAGAALGCQLYTAGTPEGMWDALAGIGKQMLCYHEEFGGFLKLLQRDHMSSAREALCSLYDGRAVGYHRAQKRGVEIYEPHVAVMATINKEELIAHATRRDLTSGYLSRFLVCAPDRTNTLADDHPFADDPQRRALIDTLVQHRQSLRDVTRVEWQESGRRDPALLLSYRLHLGIGDGRVINLDHADDEPSVPAGRLYARAKKVAALLELGERWPNVSQDGQTLAVRPEHVETAIDIIERSRAYAERMGEWIGQSPDVELGNRILRRLARRPEGMSQRELCNSLRETARDIEGALKLLEAEGRIEAARSGKVVRWLSCDAPAAFNTTGALHAVYARQHTEIA